MSTRLIKTNPQEHVTARPRVAHGEDCAHCHREALTIVNGVLIVKSAHDKTIHANAVTLAALFQFYISIANRPTLMDLRKVIDEHLQAA
jgi:hypothetical protein